MICLGSSAKPRGPKAPLPSHVLTVKLKNRPYRIFVGPGALATLGRVLKEEGRGRDAVLITTRRVLRLYGGRVLAEARQKQMRCLTLTVADTEKSKDADVALKLMRRMSAFEKQKNLLVLALGGGVVGDLSGFVAAIYKRGTPYLQVPTTLLAQIDSSIGGKTAVDTSFGKNLVGAFHQPRCVVADTQILKTLPEEEVRAGLAEAVKYALIKDRRLFLFLKNNFRKILKRDLACLTHLVACCASIKAAVVARDEFDRKGVRIILNFGHTFAHALEAASRYGLKHGPAVALGMVCACRLSEKLGLLEEKTTQATEDLLRRIGLPVRIKRLPLKTILKAMAHDKKFRRGTNRFVRLEKIGKTAVVEGISEDLVGKVLRECGAV